MLASFSKYVRVVSFSRIGGCQSATRFTAAASRTTALSIRGVDPWPAVPRATSRTPRGSFSVVATVT